MKKKTAIPLVSSGVLLLIFIIASCTKQMQSSIDNKNELPADVQWAKEYYTQTLQPQQGNEALSTSGRLHPNTSDPLSKKANMKSLLWKRAVAGLERGYTFVEVPLIL